MQATSFGPPSAEAEGKAEEDEVELKIDDVDPRIVSALLSLNRAIGMNQHPRAQV